MRHRVAHRKLNRTSAHRLALRRNLAQSLFEHGQVRTTLDKARDLQPFAERLITLAKKAAGGPIAAVRLSSRRRLHRLLNDRAIVPAEHREAYEMMSDAKRARVLRLPSGRRHRAGVPKGRLAFTAESVVHRLIQTVAPRFLDRPGGYTRLIRLADRRLGDHAPLAILQLIGDEQSPGSITKPRKTTRRRKADARYALAIKLAKGAVEPKGRPAEAAADQPPPPPEPPRESGEAKPEGGATTTPPEQT